MIISFAEKCCENRCTKFKINDEKLSLIRGRNLRPTTCGLGSYGIQLGSISVNDEIFPKEIKGKQALDAIFVAHGLNSMKPSVDWAQNDIDKILNIGTELFKATRNEKIEKNSELVKGFTLSKKFIEVTLSEPIYFGKMLTENERFMNSDLALRDFFMHHKFGIFQSTHVDLYIERKSNAFVVFDPRGRSMNCGTDLACGEAALMVFPTIDNVIHLITNLSKLKSSNLFKISTVKISRITESKFAPAKFSLIKKKCRSNNFVSLFKGASILRGNLHLSSKIFEHVGGRQHLTTSIMSIIYAKIDPPNSWSSDILDRVLHFGTRFYLDCIDGSSKKGGPLRDLKLIEIPSKFHVGDSYQATIAIVPSIQKVELHDEAIRKAIRSSFDLSFHCLLLQIDNLTLSLTQMKTSRNFFLYDSTQRDSEGNLDHFDGKATLLMFINLDDLCKCVVERIKRFSHSSSSQLDVHALRIIELLSLGKNSEHKKLPKFVLRKSQSVCPMTTSCARILNDSPSKVDSVVPLLTTEQHEALRQVEEVKKKPEYLTTTDLNSESLVCHVKCRMNDEKEKRKPTTDIIVYEVYEEMMKKATAANAPQKSDDKNKKEEDSGMKQTNDRFVTCAEKILLKTDLRCLQRERVDVIQKFNMYVDPFKVLAVAKKRDGEVSHFNVMPDKSAIVRGTRTLTDTQFPVESLYNVENFTVITAISALITSSFHPVESWSCETVDNVISTAHCMSKFVHLKHRFDFSTIVEHRMPKVQIDNRLFNVKFVAIANGDWNEIEKKLDHLFSCQQTSIVLVTSHGSLAIFSRHKFYYLFEYAKCNLLGYRKEKENSAATDDDASCCLLRFCNLHSMVKRIFANHPEMRRQQRFLICRVMVEAIEDSTNNDEKVFVPFTKSQEKEIVDKMLQAALEKLQKRLRPIDKKIQDEKERIRRFYDETGQQQRNMTINDNDNEIDMNDFKLRILNDEQDFPVTTKYHRRMYDNDKGKYSPNSL